MAEKLKIISLGGLNEIGKNLTVYEYGNDIVVVDCGMGFPDDDMYGIDVVIPDVSYLIKNQQKIRGIFITHGHEDHIGALPYVLRSVKAPIYATRMSAGLLGLVCRHSQQIHLSVCGGSNHYHAFAQLIFQLIAQAAQAVHIHALYLNRQQLHTFDFHHLAHRVADGFIGQLALQLLIL